MHTIFAESSLEQWPGFDNQNAAPVLHRSALFVSRPYRYMTSLSRGTVFHYTIKTLLLRTACLFLDYKRLTSALDTSY